MNSGRDWRHMFTLGDVLREHRRSRPDALAAVDGDVRLTYFELDERVNRVADILLRSGVEPGDRVAWLGQNSFRFLECLLAAAKLGAVFCPANWRQSLAELHAFVSDLDPRVVVWQAAEIGDVVEETRAAWSGSAGWLRHDAPSADPDGYEGLLAEAAPIDDERLVDDHLPVLALYTAAFAGQANAALLSHSALIVQNLVIGRVQEVTDATRFLNSGPLFHIGTLMTTLATLHHGGTNVFIPRANAEEVCRVVERERCTHAFLMGPTVEAIREINADGRFDVSSLWGNGGVSTYRTGSIAPPSSPWARNPGGFGQTEVVGLATLKALAGSPTGGAGRPVVAQVRVVGPDGSELAPGATGEIVVRGPIAMNGYFRRDELNWKRAEGGWHHTNDLGRREADGSLTFVGPKTRMIKSAAENIYPAEVEACLRSHPAVEDVCVIGVPDPQWTQSVKAIVVPRADVPATADDLIAHCRERIASYKKPRLVEFVEALPRDAAGLVDRDAVDAAFGGGGYPGSG